MAIFVAFSIRSRFSFGLYSTPIVWLSGRKRRIHCSCVSIGNSSNTPVALSDAPSLSESEIMQATTGALPGASSAARDAAEPTVITVTSPARRASRRASIARSCPVWSE